MHYLNDRLAPKNVPNSSTLANHPVLAWPGCYPFKGRDCEDDLNLFQYDDPKFKLILLPWMWSLNGLFNNLAKQMFLSQEIINIKKTV